MTSMAPKRAIDLIKSFELPECEQTCLIECDVRRKSYPQVQDEFGMTPEVIKRNRHRAYAKIADQLNNL